MINFPDKAHSDLQKRIAKHPNTATRDELLAMAEQNNKINGTKLHNDKLETFNAIKDAVSRFAAAHEDKYNHFVIIAENPEPSRYDANIHLITGNPFGMKSKPMQELLSTVPMADEFTICTGDDEAVTIELVWTVFDVWTEK